ncbi:putative necrosis-inducing factor-domain-containing protein [Paraphoma chrysanthemicola]|nr:putative necrosis-inducing factor-domain-containing protein [Paraphoma chrysanthemicola]
MINPITLILATLLATATCAPVSSNAQADVVKALDARASINDCADSTFENQSSGGSPKVSDCQQMAANIAGGGTWTTTLSLQRTLASYGTCAFGVKASGSSGMSGQFLVGNQDIIDVVNESIRRFQWNGLVGAKGVMPCQTGQRDDAADVSWGLYHS